MFASNPYRSRAWRLALNVFVLLSLLCSVCFVPTQQAQAEDLLYGLISLSDTTLRGGGTVVVNAYKLAPGMYRVGMLDTFNHFIPGYTFYARPNSSGQLYAKITVPQYHPGTQTIAIDLGNDILVRGKDFTLQPAMQLSVNPASAFPGDTATVTMTNLEPGYVTVRLGDVIVAGPTSTKLASLTTTFVVPRGLNISDTVKVLEAVNENRGVKFSSDKVNFTLLAPRPAVNPQFSGVTITPNPLMPGQKFTISGRLWPLPAGFTPITKDAVYDPNFIVNTESMMSAAFEDDLTHETVIVAGELSSFSNNGYFMYEGYAPDKRYGGELSMRENMTVNLNYIFADMERDTDLSLSGPQDPTLTIRTTELDGTPVDTDVYITDITPEDNPYEATIGEIGVRTDLLDNKNLINFLCQEGNLEGAYETGADGLLHFASRVEDLVTRPVDAMLSGQYDKKPAFYNYQQMPGVVTDGQGAAPDGAQAHTFWQPGADEWENFRYYDVYVDGRRNGFSYGRTWNVNMPVAVYHDRIWYDMAHGIMYNYIGEPLQNYVGGDEIALYFAPVNLGEMDSLISIQGVWPTAGAYTGSGDDYLTYTGFFDLSASVFTWAKWNMPKLLNVNYTWDEDVNGAMMAINVLYDNNDFPTYELDAYSYVPETGGNQSVPECPSGDALRDGQSVHAKGTFEASFPFPTDLSAGEHVVHLRFITQDGFQFYRHFGIKVEAPPAWILGASLSQQKVEYTSDGSYLFSAMPLDSYSDNWGDGTDEASANVPNVGQMTNKVGPSVVMVQKYQNLANGNASSEALNQLQSTVSSEGTRALSNAPTDAVANVAQGLNNLTINIGPTTIPLAYVAMPVFVAAFEDPFGGAIVNGTTGMLIETYAEVTLNGSVSPSLVDLTISPYAQINSQIWLDINILYGILAQSALTFYPKFSLNMPVNFKVWPMEQEVDLNIEGVCFGYRGDMYFYFGFICPPIIGCIVEHEGMVNIYNGTISHGSAACAMRDDVFMADLPTYGPPIPDATLLKRFNASKPIIHEMDLSVSPLGVVNLLELTGTNTIQVQEYDLGSWAATREIKTGEGNNNFRQAWLTATTSILAYTDTAYTQAELETASLTAVANSQYIGWMLDNGATQTVPAALTPPNSGDGQVSLASCNEEDAGCPTGGQVTAAWNRMKTNDPYKGGYRVGYATYQSGAWSTPTLIAAPSGRSDAQARVIYRGTQPYIYFVRDFDGTGETTDDRYLFQYKPGDANPTIVSGIPAGIIEFSLAVDSDDNPSIAFTRVDASNVGLFDNRHPLYTAKGACTGDSCTWAVNKLKDQHQRDIYAEGPKLNINPNGEAVISYRGMGMGPDLNGSYAPHLSDTVGIIHQTGELAQVTTLFDGEMTIPDYLTGDGAVNWNVQAAFDRQAGELLTTAVRSQHLSQLRAYDVLPQPDPFDARAISEDSPLIFAVKTDQPNFKLDSVSAASPYITSSDTITVTVDLHNAGSDWTGAATNPVAIVATWDGPYGSGTVAVTTTITAMESGVATQVSLLVPIPENPDLNHTLHVTITAPMDALESTVADNALFLNMGGIPAPQALSALKAPADPILMLNWQAPNDARIDHYNVYRSVSSGAIMLMGSVTDTVLIDSDTTYGQSYAYWVSAVTTSGAESPLSNKVEIAIPLFKVFMPLLVK